MANAFINPMIDSLVSPEGLAAMMNGHKPSLATQKEKSPDAHAGASDDEPIVKMGYENFNRFTVTTSDKNHPTKEVTMVYLRDVLSWKLSAIRFPTDDAPIADAKWISIESSDMEADPTQTNVVTLSAHLRNHAPYTQAYPNLELTLTNAQEKPIARRTFIPAEYVSTSEKNNGIHPNQEFKVQLLINTLELNPSDYRLFLFYPEQEKKTEQISLPTIQLVAPDSAQK